MQCGLLLTAIWTFLAFHNVVQLSKVPALRQPGYLDFDNLPETNFTCEGKVIGGYYADIETGCQMFHVCTIGQKGDMTDIKFLCLNGTVFDQETRVCERVDEVDCSKSKDFYDLNLELYNRGFIVSEEEGKDDSKVDENSESEEVYDDYETEEPAVSTTKGSRPGGTTSTTTTTTTTTTPKPIFTTVRPTFAITVPKNENSHVITLHQQGYDNRGGQLSTVRPSKPQIGGDASIRPGYLGLKEQSQSLENKNVGTHLTGLIPTKALPTPRPYGYVTTQSYDPGHYHQIRPVEAGIKPPPTSYKPFVPSSSYRPPSYDTYKNHYFPSSTPNPITSILINNYNQKHQAVEEIRPSGPAKRPVVVVSHHFPTLTPVKTGYDEFGGFTGPSGPSGQYVRHRQHPQLQQQQQSRPSVKITHHQRKANPTILELQSQQKMVHQLHQEGLEIAEHQIAQIANRNAEISSLRSQKLVDRSDQLETQPSHRETKEIHIGNAVSYSKPAIAIVTSTSSTSSRVQNKPVVTTYVKTVTTGKTVVYKQEPEYKSELEKLFEQKEGKQDEEDEEGSEESSEMDLEQLLLAWKLKTNQEVTREDIEKVFSSLDTSKFKNGQTISLSDIFDIVKNSSAEETTRVPPSNYNDYTEEDVPYDPFYKDVPKVINPPKRLKRSDAEITNVKVLDNGRFEGRESRRKVKQGGEWKAEGIILADFTVLMQDDTRTQRGKEVEPSTTTPRAFPVTEFTCDGKIPGGLYADTQVDCRIYHICGDANNGSLIDHKFFCGDGTKFNQKSRTCEAEESVDCPSSPDFYHLNENFRIPPTEITPQEVTFESIKIQT